MPARTKSILVLCPFPEGCAAGQRLKYEQYLEDWRSHGYDVEVRPFMDQAMWQVVHQPGRLLSKILGTLRGLHRRRKQMKDVANFDLVYVFLWASPIGSERIERKLRQASKRLIYDIEDNILDPSAGDGQLRPNPLIRWLRGNGKARYLVKQADHVIASSPDLATRCKSLNKRHAATYISSSVNTDLFLPVNDYANDDTVVIGWTGTISSLPYLDLLRRVFQRLSDLRDFRLRVIGNCEYDLPGVNLEVLRWSARDEVAQMQGIDIGVYPLPKDSWVGGKSGLKAIQYAAFGIPCVASRVGHTPNVVADGKTGLLVDDEAGWISALTNLIDDPDLRRRLGTSAREWAVANYSVKAVADDYRKVIDDVMNKPLALGDYQEQK